MFLLYYYCCRNIFMLFSIEMQNEIYAKRRKDGEKEGQTNFAKGRTSLSRRGCPMYKNGVIYCESVNSLCTF